MAWRIKMIMNYKDQLSEIKKLTKSINKKAKKFVKDIDEVKYPYCEDLSRIIRDLNEANNFLKWYGVPIKELIKNEKRARKTNVGNNP